MPGSNVPKSPLWSAPPHEAPKRRTRHRAGTKGDSLPAQQGAPYWWSESGFLLHHGFTLEQWQVLAERLLHHAFENEVVASDENPHGVRYAVDGPLIAPTGKSLNIRTAWFINHGSETPRFITAHPLPKP